MYVVPHLRQADNTNDRYNSNSESGDFRYQRLGNTSVSNSEGSLNLSNEGDNYPRMKTFLQSETGPRLAKSISDQQIPEIVDKKFVYVNKNGLAAHIAASPPKPVRCNENSTRVLPKNNEVVCNAFLVEMAKASKTNNIGYQEFNNNYQSLKGKNVPTIADDLNKSGNDSSQNNSLGIIYFRIFFLNVIQKIYFFWKTILSHST